MRTPLLSCLPAQHHTVTMGCSYGAACLMCRAPSKKGTTADEYMRFWVYMLECTCRMADNTGEQCNSVSARTSHGGPTPLVVTLELLWVPPWSTGHSELSTNAVGIGVMACCLVLYAESCSSGRGE